MTKRYEEVFNSEADGLRISALAILPEAEPYRGIVQLVHGMCENKERYEPFMEYLAEEGFVTVIHDHRGHGASVENKEDLGYMYGGGAESMLKDIDTVNREVKKRFPDLPLILFGHSMGSLAVRAYASRHDKEMDMLIVCGSPSENAGRPLGNLIAHGESKVFGPRHKSRVLEVLSFGGYVKKFAGEKNRNAWICSDPEVYKAYSESELCGFTFTDDAYISLFQLMKEAYDVYHWSCANPHMPVLFLSGAQDPCMGNVRKFAHAVHAMRRAGYLDVKGHLYKGMRHEILNEKGKEQVYKDIVYYINRKFGGKKK